MADSLNSKLTLTFKNYVEVGSGCQAQTPTDESKNQITDKGMNRLLKDCCGDDVAKASETQVFAKYCDKNTKTLSIGVFLDEFLPELAATVIQIKQKLPTKPDLKNEEVIALLKELMEQISAKADAKPMITMSIKRKVSETNLLASMDSSCTSHDPDINIIYEAGCVPPKSKESKCPAAKSCSGK